MVSNKCLGQPVAKARRIMTAIKYTICQRGLLLLLTLFIGVIFILVLGKITEWDLGGPWGWVQNLATCFTLVIAILIWISERYRDWNESLPKRLTARFIFYRQELKKDIEVMVCEEAYLAGESDIRAWAQQLGSQMSDGEMLHFFPSLDQSKPYVLRDSGDGHLFVHYTVCVRLRKLPKLLEHILAIEPSPNYPLVHWTRPGFFDQRYAGLGHPLKPGSSQRQTP